MTTIEKIESYGAHYNPDSGLCLEDQLLACEAIAESSPVIEHRDTEEQKQSSEQVSSVNDSVSDLRYLEVNLELIANYQIAIIQLKGLSSFSEPPKIAEILRQTFTGSTKEGHWLWLAQHYNPRQITWVLTKIKKRTERGDKTIENPGGYFTSILKRRQPRAEFKKKEASK